MMRTLQYGPSESHVGDLYTLTGATPPVVCLLHGGFWRMPYGRDEMSAVAADLAARGYAVWAGGRVPGTSGLDRHLRLAGWRSLSSQLGACGPKLARSRRLGPPDLFRELLAIWRHSE